MISSINRKKDIYDKRPEDHPNYGEEWRDFWERRYKEVKDEGMDAENHDYKTEWIPFWGKRVEELFENEVRS